MKKMGNGAMWAEMAHRAKGQCQATNPCHCLVDPCPYISEASPYQAPPLDHKDPEDTRDSMDKFHKVGFWV